MAADRSVANHGKLTISSVVAKSWLLRLLYIQLTISFLIGRKRTVNFRNQRLGRHLAADYTIIMSRTLKVTGNHVMYDRGAWFLRVTMSSSRALLLAVSEEAKTWLPSLLRWPSETSKKIVEDKDSQNTKISTKVAKELFADYVKEKKLREPEEKKELAQTLKTFYVEARKKGFVQCIIKQLLDSVFVISRIIKVSVRVIGWGW